jgi:hypothetical protein
VVPRRWRFRKQSALSRSMGAGLDRNAQSAVEFLLEIDELRPLLNSRLEVPCRIASSVARWCFVNSEIWFSLATLTCLTA